MGDPQAVNVAIEVLLSDKSKLVRWRAARILGELGGSNEKSLKSSIIALESAARREGESFEVTFEINRCLSILQGTNPETAAKVFQPVWQKIIER